MNLSAYRAGLKAGLPICLGYFSVSFGFGTLAITQGLSILQATILSITNLTSAGQFAGLTVIVTGASLLEMILTQLVINSRYALMSLALGQRLGPSVGIGKRLAVAFFNTDEVFALGMAQSKLTPAFFLGAGTVAAIGWTGGTAMGAIAGSILPASLQTALGIMLYGMFIAIVVPQAKQEKSMGICMILALIFSCLFTYLPILSAVSAGIAIVLCTVAAAAICAWVFPIPDEEVAA